MYFGICTFLILLPLLSSPLNAQQCDFHLSDKAVPYYNPAFDTFLINQIKAIDVNLNEDISNIQGKDKSDFKEVLEGRAEFYKGLLEDEHVFLDDSLQQIVDYLGQKIIDSNNIYQEERIRFLISREGIPNAYSGGEGIIVINLGLISRIKDWDELAFYICHELAHHHLKHSQQMMADKIELLNSKELKAKVRAAKRGKVLANSALEEYVVDVGLSYAKHSRIAELETDALGFQFYENAGFRLGSAYQAMNTLKNTEHPKYPLPPLEDIFNFDDFPWQEHWASSHLKGLSAAPLSNKEKEKFKTHPEIEKRIDQIKSLTPDTTLSIDESICDQSCALDLESLEYYYEYRNYFAGLVLGLQLHGVNPKNDYVNEVIANCLLDICVARKEHHLSRYIPPPGRKLSVMQNQVATFLDNLSFTEIKTITKEFIHKYNLLKEEDVNVPQLEEKLELLQLN